MAAFAFSNGDAKASYRALYRTFRAYYGEHRNTLDELELAFVFCVRPDLPHFEQFCSEVETDVYFCRKFVIRLMQQVGESLGRLPFLPLTPSVETSPRPPSAQTYLRECDVPALLAGYLAVPHRRGAASIARECVRSTSEWTPTVRPPMGRPEGISESTLDRTPTRLDSIAIESFRAYRRRQELRFGAAATVIYGPNGFGKTSLFDAIEFAATGTVGRLGRLPTDRARRALAHLDGRVTDSVVSLVFGVQDTSHTIHRSVASPMRAHLDRKPLNRKSIISALTRPGGHTTDRVDHLAELFRATHLFSQEDPALATNFRRTSSLPPTVVSRMLAFEDYSAAHSKASDVCGVFAQWIARAQRNLTELTTELHEAKAIVRTLRRSHAPHTEIERPSEALATLRRRVRDAELSIRSTEGTDQFVRECRTAIVTAYTEKKGALDRLTTLVEQARAVARTQS